MGIIPKPGCRLPVPGCSSCVRCVHTQSGSVKASKEQTRYDASYGGTTSTNAQGEQGQHLDGLDPLPCWSPWHRLVFRFFFPGRLGFLPRVRALSPSTVDGNHLSSTQGSRPAQAVIKTK